MQPFQLKQHVAELVASWTDETLHAADAPKRLDSSWRIGVPVAEGIIAAESLNRRMKRASSR